LDPFCGVYLTRETLASGMQRVYGVTNENISRRFYYFLTSGFEQTFIYISDFTARLWGLAEGGFIERNSFAFQMLDGDHDGVISATDLIAINEQMLNHFCAHTEAKTDICINRCHCVLSRETSKLYKF
jgi:hypothetical protein